MKNWCERCRNYPSDHCLDCTHTDIGCPPINWEIKPDIYNNVYILKRRLSMQDQIDIYSRAGLLGLRVEIEGCKVIFPRGYRDKETMIEVVENTCARTQAHAREGKVVS